MSLSRIMLQLPSRDLTLGDHAAFLLEATRRLQQLDGRLSGFCVDLGRRRGVPLASVDDFAEQLKLRHDTFTRGEATGARGRLMIAVPEGRRIRMHASFIFGHDVGQGVRKGFPAALKLRWMGREAPPADTWRRMLVSLVDLYRPLWATLGGSLTPTPTIDERAAPLVGWDTFLCREYGRLPELPEETTVTPWGDIGSIVRAFPEVLRESEPKHLAGLTAVRRALVEGGVLKHQGELEQLPPPMPPPRNEPVAAQGDASAPDASQVALNSNATDETMVVSFFHKPSSALPFREGGGVPRSAPADADERVPMKGGTLDAPVGFDPAGGTLILQPDAGSASGEHPLMSATAITRYARMHAELAHEARPVVLARYAVRDERELSAIDDWWRTELEQQPMKQVQFRALYEKYVREQGEGGS